MTTFVNDYYSEIQRQNNFNIDINGLNLKIIVILYNDVKI